MGQKMTHFLTQVFCLRDRWAKIGHFGQIGHFAWLMVRAIFGYFSQKWSFGIRFQDQNNQKWLISGLFEIWSFWSFLDFVWRYKGQKWQKMGFLAWLKWLILEPKMTHFGAKNDSFCLGHFGPGPVPGTFRWLGRTGGSINRQPRLARLRGAPGSAGLRNGKNRLSVAEKVLRELFPQKWIYCGGFVKKSIFRKSAIFAISRITRKWGFVSQFSRDAWKFLRIFLKIFLKKIKNFRAKMCVRAVTSRA